ncbi:hypothetical protein AB0K14_09175 [Actinosynnema sp. NPDC050801]|uniref:hypothetical protein n=1 Tax=unclassified Actinosynnema TaxID=2637065 RepID=UPI0033D108CC
MPEGTLDSGLVDRLSVTVDRLGWEHVEPAPITPSPEANQPPGWYEPPVPAGMQQRVPGAAIGCGLLVLVPSLMLLLFVLSTGPEAVPGALVLCGIGLVILVVPIVSTRMSAAKVRREYRTYRENLWHDYQRATSHWQDRVNAHNAAELMRWVSTKRWYPLVLRGRPSRIDVFGGTEDGWASLLATFGAALLEQGNGVFVLDFTEQQVAGGLAAVSTAQDLPVTGLELPERFADLDLVEGLGSEELAELLAEAVSTMRPAGNGPDLRALDAELFVAVLDRLVEPATFARLAAGLKVLRRIYDGGPGGPLTAAEVGQLNAAVDVVVHTDQTRQELQFLSSVLDLVVRGDVTPAGGASLQSYWPRRGVAVIETTSSHRRRKDLIDRLLFHRVLHDLRNTPRGRGSGVLVIAGADEVGVSALRELARQAERTGVMLVLMMHRLDEDLQQLLGSADSVSVVMRLGNGKEAAVAAEYIGREHKFTLSQLTYQFGKTITEGRAVSLGGSDSVARTTGHSSSSSSGFSGEGGGTSSYSSGFNSSVTRTRTSTWQNTESYAEADSTTDGRTESRVYEFSVEPTSIQALPVTSFIMVESAQSGRRAVLGDCNPGIVLLDKVSQHPRLG